MAPLDAKGSGSDYRDGWSAISSAMEDGVSWSGHERNVAWLSAGDGTFLDVSAVSGFDQIEDGRVVCKADWDRDGDMDLWLRSRNGATLRYLENQSNPERFIEVDLPATRTSYTLGYTAGDRRVTKRIAAALTDGYLAAPGRRSAVALPMGAVELTIDGVAVGESDGASVRVAVGAGGALAALAGPEPESRAARGSLGAGALELGDLPTRTVLRSPLPIPPARLLALGVEDVREPNVPAARLLIVRSDSCPTCEAVLPNALGSLAAGAVRVDVTEFPVSLELEGLSDDQVSSAAAVRGIASSLLGPGAELALPLSLLLDERGVTHVLYQGNLIPEDVALDAQTFILEPVQAAFRGGPPQSRSAAESTGGPAPGSRPRWFHGSPRSFASLRSALQSSGLQADADFYAAPPGSGR